MKCQRSSTLLILFTLTLLSTCAVCSGAEHNCVERRLGRDQLRIQFAHSDRWISEPATAGGAAAEASRITKCRLEGHADVIGSNRYNERLGQRRAETVKAFLVKYGANANQLTTATFGETQPKITDRVKEARFMNRRVFMTVTDASGQDDSRAGGISEVNEELEKFMADQRKCCEEILKRLDKLDQIANMLQKMAGDNDALRKDLGNLQKAHDALDQYVKGLPKPLTAAETSQIVDTRTAEQIERARMPRFSIVGLNAGADQSGNLTIDRPRPLLHAIQGTVRRAVAGRIYVLPRPAGRAVRLRSCQPLRHARASRLLRQLEARELQRSQSRHQHLYGSSRGVIRRQSAVQHGSDHGRRAAWTGVVRRSTICSPAAGWVSSDPRASSTMRCSIACALAQQHFPGRLTCAPSIRSASARRSAWRAMPIWKAISAI